MTESLDQMKDTIDHLAIEEGSLEENAETEEQPEIAAYMDQRSTQQSHKNQQSGSAVSNSGARKPTSSQTTEQSINTLINQSSESQRDVPDGEIDLLKQKIVLRALRSTGTGQDPLLKEIIINNTFYQTKRIKAAEISFPVIAPTGVQTMHVNVPKHITDLTTMARIPSRTSCQDRLDCLKLDQCNAISCSLGTFNRSSVNTLLKIHALRGITETVRKEKVWLKKAVKAPNEYCLPPNCLLEEYEKLIFQNSEDSVALNRTILSSDLATLSGCSWLSLPVIQGVLDKINSQSTDTRAFILNNLIGLKGSALLKLVETKNGKIKFILFIISVDDDIKTSVATPKPIAWILTPTVHADYLRHVFIHWLVAKEVDLKMLGRTSSHHHEDIKPLSSTTEDTPPQCQQPPNDEDPPENNQPPCEMAQNAAGDSEIPLHSQSPREEIATSEVDDTPHGAQPACGITHEDYENGQQSSTKVQSSVPEKMPQSKEPAKRSQRTALSAGENTADDCLLLKAQDNNSQEFPSNIEPAHLESDDYPLGQQPFTAAIKRSSDVNFEDSKKGKLDPLTEDSDDF
ncbi:hypothetical protein AWC38_SpisGene3452 [Stylophora pistillata]|uniref:Uncharacterized protein n=1 Tax=Stylophora pistillata TaxID=50429 RepID=A0A2B4STH9_STYPI|nr:hypothetical protein AWC38_SpisGene3452 [Stylophora pistillata]